MLTIDAPKISEFRAFMSEKGKQKSTLESYCRDLANFLGFLSQSNTHTGDISGDVLEEYKGWLLNRGAKPSSIRRGVIAIRMFFRWLEESGQLHGNPLESLSIPSHENLAARHIPEEKITLMLNAAHLAPNAIKAARDVALLLLLSREGLKASELVSLRWSNFFASGDSGRLTIQGDRARTIDLEAETAAALKNFRKVIQTDARTKHQFTGSTPLLMSFKGADARTVLFGITRHGLKFAIYELGETAGLKHLNAEQLRHVAMSRKISLGFTPEMVMNHLGLRRIGNIGKHVPVTSIS
jgi:site-specific recombinase XerD